jgi:glycolate oxidase iron-sulfur subunit
MCAKPLSFEQLKELDYSVLQQCMHCGMCLPTCPTYLETGRERNSPRGRIALVRALADEEITLDEAFADEMSFCLGCLTCTTACPAGVDYGKILETARAAVEESGIRKNWGRKFIRWSVMKTVFTHPWQLRLMGRMLWFYERSGLQFVFRKLRLNVFLTPTVKTLEPFTPSVKTKFTHQLIKEKEPAYGKQRYNVAVLSGCVQDILFSDINRATVNVLRENGCFVFTPNDQVCCGSLHIHNGEPDTAKELAKHLIDQINPFEFDAIISNAGGCGSHLKHYQHLLETDSAYAGKAEEWSRKLKDISEFLVEIGFRKPNAPQVLAGNPAPVSIITYHEACHLFHGQGISAAPREIIQALPNMRFVECKDATKCCGSAGVYNISQPEMASILQYEKVNNLEATEASIVATANPGCHLQIENGYKLKGPTQVRVVHPVVLLDEAYKQETNLLGEKIA